jgi:hypothetical protein
MQRLIVWVAPLAASAFVATAVRAEGEPSASYDTTLPVTAPASAASPGAQNPPEPDTQSLNAGLTKVERVAKKGFAFYPSVQDAGAFRFAVGAFYDAIDPAVVYGFNVRVPQVTLDARYGLGEGWSLKGHLNSFFVTTELLLGGSYAWHAGSWSLEGTMSVGVYIGKLAQLGFDALLLSPEYRPELALGYDLGKVALSLRGSLLLMGPEKLRIGDVSGGLDNSHAFVGHSEMLYVENTTQSNGVWYFGAGAMTTRAYYALWLLFPDSPGLFTYPRIVAGYEF